MTNTTEIAQYSWRRRAAQPGRGDRVGSRRNAAPPRRPYNPGQSKTAVTGAWSDQRLS